MYLKYKIINNINFLADLIRAWIIGVSLFIVLPFNLLANTQDSLGQIWKDPTLPDTVRLEALYQLNLLDLSGTVPDLNESLIKELIEMGHSAGSEYYEALGVNLLGVSYQNKGKMDSSMMLYKKALKLAVKANEPTLTMKVRGNIAYVQIMSGNLVEAMDILRESEQLILASDIYEEDQLAQIYNAFLLIYYSIEDWENAVIYARKTIKHTSKENQNIGNYYNLGYALTMTEQYEEAISAFNQSLNLCYKHEETGILKAGALIGLAKVYAKRNEQEIAQQYIRSANEITRKVPLSLGTVSILIDKLDIYVELGLDEQSFQLAQKLYTYPDLKRIPVFRKKVTEALFKYYRSQDEQQKALDILDEYLEATEQLNKADAEKEVLRNTLQLDFEKKALTDSLKQIREQAAIQAEYQKQLHSKKRTRNITFGIGLFIALIAIGLYSRVRTMGRMNKKMDDLLLNILPRNVAKQLKEQGKTEAKSIEMATILFSDFENFTEIADRIRAGELVEELNYYFSSFDKITKKYGIEKIKTIGDAYMAAGGVPSPVAGSVRNTVLAALEMQEIVGKRKQFNLEKGFPVIEMRLGIHTGPVIAGVVGVSKFQYDLWGDTVNVASRIETSCSPGKVNISQRTYEFIKDDNTFKFESRGKLAVKGKGDVEMYYVDKSFEGVNRKLILENIKKG